MAIILYALAYHRPSRSRVISHAVIDILETRFVTVPTTLIAHIQHFEDHDKLRHLLKQAVLLDSLETFSQLVMVGITGEG